MCGSRRLYFVASGTLVLGALLASGAALGALLGPAALLGATALHALGPGRLLLQRELSELGLSVGHELVLLGLVLFVVLGLLVLLEDLVVLRLERCGLVLVRFLLARGQLTPHLAELLHGVLV